MFKYLLGYIPPLPSIEQCCGLLGTNKTFPSPPGSIVPVICCNICAFSTKVRMAGYWPSLNSFVD